MARAANTFSTYSAIGIREDLRDLIANISPVDTMFYSSLKEVGAKQTYIEWQVDALAAAADNAHVEGDQESADAITPTTRLGNTCQIQKKSFSVSNTEEKVVKAGRSSEVNYQTAKKGKELSKDVEYAFLQSVEVQDESSSQRHMQGIINFVQTNLDKASDGTLAADGTITGGTARDLTEDIFKGVLQDAFDQGGNPSVCYLGSWQKGVISGWPNVSTTNYRTMVNNKTMNASIDVYVGDFGTVAFKPHRGMPADQMIILDPQYKGSKATLRNTHRERLAITGDSQDWVIRVEHALYGVEEAAHARITNLTTS